MRRVCAFSAAGGASPCNGPVTITRAIPLLKESVSTPVSLRKRVLSGMRPTGKLHLGNYMGALHNWVRLQDSYECFFFIADVHALTTDYADPAHIAHSAER